MDTPADARFQDLERIATTVKQSIAKSPSFVAMIADQAFLGVDGDVSVADSLDRFPKTELAQRAAQAPPLGDMPPLDRGALDWSAFALVDGKGASRADLARARQKKQKKLEKKKKKDKKKRKRDAME